MKEATRITIGPIANGGGVLFALAAGDSDDEVISSEYSAQEAAKLVGDILSACRKSQEQARLPVASMQLGAEETIVVPSAFMGLSAGRGGDEVCLMFSFGLARFGIAMSGTALENVAKNYRKLLPGPMPGKPQ